MYTGLSKNTTVHHNGTETCECGHKRAEKRALSSVVKWYKGELKCRNLGIKKKGTGTEEPNNRYCLRIGRYVQEGEEREGGVVWKKGTTSLPFPSSVTTGV